MKSSGYQLVMSAMFKGEKGEQAAHRNPDLNCLSRLDGRDGRFISRGASGCPAMADLALAGHEMVGFDYGHARIQRGAGSAALGAMSTGVIANDAGLQVVSYEDFADIRLPRNLLEKPSMKVRARCPVHSAPSSRRSVAIIGKAMGPWTLSYHMAGTQNFLLQIGLGRNRQGYENGAPIDTCHHRLCTRTISGRCRYRCIGRSHHRQFGRTAITMRELLLPIHQEIDFQITARHFACLRQLYRSVQYFAEAGVDAYHMEWQVDAKLAVEKIGHKVSLVGNVNNPQTLYQGTPEDVYQQVRYAVEAGVNIIAPECAIPLSTPLENLKAIVAAVQEGY